MTRGCVKWCCEAQESSFVRRFKAAKQKGYLIARWKVSWNLHNAGWLQYYRLFVWNNSLRSFVFSSVKNEVVGVCDYFLEEKETCKKCYPTYRRTYAYIDQITSRSTRKSGACHAHNNTTAFSSMTRKADTRSRRLSPSWERVGSISPFPARDFVPLAISFESNPEGKLTKVFILRLKTT